jgi:DtxR family transcriptional regulator, Mn-dependent transcriptional regulator
MNQVAHQLKASEMNPSELDDGFVPVEPEVLSASQEDYLEAILQLERASRVARVSEIALRLNVSRPSVTGALKNLVGLGLVSHARYGHATLTEEGTKIAREVERRHMAIRDFLTYVLGIEEQKAETTACRLEHVLEPDVLEHFVSYAESLAGLQATTRTGAEGAST